MDVSKLCSVVWGEAFLHCFMMKLIMKSKQGINTLLELNDWIEYKK